MKDSHHAISLRINGTEHEVAVDTSTTLADVLRYDLGLTGTRIGCNEGVCGACTVLLDGKPVRGCLTLAATVFDREVTTIEGLAEGGELSALQKAFSELGAVQCGYCIPGMIVSAHAVLKEKPDAGVDDIRRGLAGNICRCSGYVKIIDAVRSVSGG